jgi:hypothetical protein
MPVNCIAPDLAMREVAFAWPVCALLKRYSVGPCSSCCRSLLRHEMVCAILIHPDKPERRPWQSSTGRNGIRWAR